MERVRSRRKGAKPRRIGRHGTGCATRMLKTVSAAMTTDVVMADPPEDARTVWEQVRTAGVANVPVGTGRGTKAAAVDMAGHNV
ncbi:hypothetical protein ABIE69_000644 [Rhodobacteraceae bacterium MBR-64]